MKTVHEVSALSGISIRTLQYYDRIGLLPPTGRTEAGYRLYDDAALERLQQILLFRALQFPLKDIRRILDRPDFDRNRALEQQIALLTLQKEHLENLILLATGLKQGGMSTMDFTAFDTKKIDDYAAEAKAAWGATPEYREFAQKDANRTDAERSGITSQMMAIFARFGAVKEQSPESEPAQALVQELQDFIGSNFYRCSDSVLKGLGQLYGNGGDFTENINAAAGDGAAEFASAAIAAYCAKKGV